MGSLRSLFEKIQLSKFMIDSWYMDLAPIGDFDRLGDILYDVRRILIRTIYQQNYKVYEF